MHATGGGNSNQKRTHNFIVTQPHARLHLRPQAMSRKSTHCHPIHFPFTLPRPGPLPDPAQAANTCQRKCRQVPSIVWASIDRFWGAHVLYIQELPKCQALLQTCVNAKHSMEAGPLGGGVEH